MHALGCSTILQLMARKKERKKKKENKDNIQYKKTKQLCTYFGPKLRLALVDQESWTQHHGQCLDIQTEDFPSYPDA